jgi:hypothetical protein
MSAMGVRLLGGLELARNLHEEFIVSVRECSTLRRTALIP